MVSEAGWRWEQEDLMLEVQVQPRAARSEWAGWSEGRLRLRLQAPPLENRANRACEAFVAKAFDVPKSRVRVLRGQHARVKTLLIEHPDPTHAQAVLSTLTQS